MAGFTDRRGPLSTGNPVRRILKDLSNLGMAYDDMIIRNSRAVGFTENQMGYTFNPMGSDSDDMYGAFAALSLTDTNYEERILHSLIKIILEKVINLEPLQYKMK